jgi:hypothetical protein
LELELLIFNLWSCEGGERGLNRFEELTQKIDLSQKGEEGILEATYILKCMLQETYPRRRRDNLLYMFACNTPST